MKQNIAVFLDRDGVLTPDVGYPYRMKDAVLFSDVIPALRRIQKAGYDLFMISNQSAVGRGMYPLSAVRRFNEKLRRQINDAGIAFGKESIYVCPHAPEDNCDCRKPKPGLLMRAAEEHQLDLSRSFLIGDKKSDMLAGLSAGVATILLLRSSEPKGSKSEADFVVSDLIEAAKLVVDEKGAEASSDNGSASAHRNRHIAGASQMKLSAGGSGRLKVGRRSR